MYQEPEKPIPEKRRQRRIANKMEKIEPERAVVSIMFFAAKNSTIVQKTRTKLRLWLNLGKRNALHVKYKQKTSMEIQTIEIAYSIIVYPSKAKICSYIPSDTYSRLAIQSHSGAKHYYQRVF